MVRRKKLAITAAIALALAGVALVLVLLVQAGWIGAGALAGGATGGRLGGQGADTGSAGQQAGHANGQVPRIPVIKSPVDFNNNGIDDYADFVIGAREYVATKPHYASHAYFQGGYPPADIGVCTDVIWQAFKNAGYSLKDMVDMDIRNNPSAYPRITGGPDPNIDFRRVKNLDVYFRRHAVSLTTDKTKIREWNAGDIVVYRHPDHIAIISDKRGADGIPYIIHNAGRPEEADAINFSEIIGHYRFDASKLDPSELIAFGQ